MIHPLNDRLKVKIDKDEFGFDPDKIGYEKGIVVEVPDNLLYLSFHSFAFEHSIGDDSLLKKAQEFYGSLVGKRVFWESLQERGRRMKEVDGEYVYLQMTDVLAYADSLEDEAEIVNEVGASGSYNLQ